MGSATTPTPEHKDIKQETNVPPWLRTLVAFGVFALVIAGVAAAGIFVFALSPIMLVAAVIAASFVGAMLAGLATMGLKQLFAVTTEPQDVVTTKPQDPVKFTAKQIKQALAYKKKALEGIKDQLGKGKEGLDQLAADKDNNSEIKRPKQDIHKAITAYDDIIPMFAIQLEEDNWEYYNAKQASELPDENELYIDKARYAEVVELFQELTAENKDELVNDYLEKREKEVPKYVIENFVAGATTVMDYHKLKAAIELHNKIKDEKDQTQVKNKQSKRHKYGFVNEYNQLQFLHASDIIDSTEGAKKPCIIFDPNKADELAQLSGLLEAKASNQDHQGIVLKSQGNSKEYGEELISKAQPIYQKYKSQKSQNKK